MTHIHISSGKATAIAGYADAPLVSWNDQVSNDGTTLSSDDGVLTDGALANAANLSTADFWRPDVFGTSVTYKISRASDFTVNFMAVCRHNFASYGASVRPRYSTDGGSTWNPCDSIAATAIATNENFCFYFQDIDAADFQIQITGLTASDPIRAAVIWIGRALQFPYANFAGERPPIAPTRVDTMQNVTEGGNFIANGYKGRGISKDFNANYMTQDWIRGTGSSFPAFQKRFNRGQPFFYGWRPTSYDDELMYCWRDGPEIVPQNMGVKGYTEISSSVRGYDDKS